MLPVVPLVNAHQSRIKIKNNGLPSVDLCWKRWASKYPLSQEKWSGLLLKILDYSLGIRLTCYHNIKSSHAGV